MELPIKTEIIGLDKADITKIISLYSKTLAYHNFNHIIEVLLAAKKIMEDCASENININEKIVNLLPALLEVTLEIISFKSPLELI